MIRKRFTDEQIDFLIRFKWWDKDRKWIADHHKIFQNIELFMKEFNP
jgi:hypothetical protein